MVSVPRSVLETTGSVVPRPEVPPPLSPRPRPPRNISSVSAAVPARHTFAATRARHPAHSCSTRVSRRRGPVTDSAVAELGTAGRESLIRGEISSESSELVCTIKRIRHSKWPDNKILMFWFYSELFEPVFALAVNFEYLPGMSVMGDTQPRSAADLW